MSTTTKVPDLRKVRLHIYIEPMLDAVLYRINVGPTEFFNAAAAYFLHSPEFKVWKAQTTAAKRARRGQPTPQPGVAPRAG